MIEKQRLGSNGPGVGRLGYGAMVLEGYYGASDDAQATRTIQRALDVGMNMIDTADAHGNGHNEMLVGRAIADRREQALVATRFGIGPIPGTRRAERIAENAKAADVRLTPELLERIDALARPGLAEGATLV